MVPRRDRVPPDEHCNAARTRAGDGSLCKLPAGWGTDHVAYGRCRRHGGNGPHGRRQGARLKIDYLARNGGFRDV